VGLQQKGKEKALDLLVSHLSPQRGRWFRGEEPLGDNVVFNNEKGMIFAKR
jgi:hypothetical protein